MSYRSPHRAFIFEGYSFDATTATAAFRYSFDARRSFVETVVFPVPDTDYAQATLESALQLAFYLAGISYYKTFPTKEVIFQTAQPDARQAEFLQTVYTYGFSQFMFENGLTPKQLASFSGEGIRQRAASYRGDGMVALQSGGKDSLLLATLLEEKELTYTPWHVKYGPVYPVVLDGLRFPLRTVERHIDTAALKAATAEGGLNGHVPITYIIMSYALIDAILHGQKTVLAAIGNEGEEPHDFIGDIPVNHQWSKTWAAEQLFAQYVAEYISPDLQVGSPLRGFSELRIAELFVEKCWQKYGRRFSSCNRANYQQGADNTQLAWCGECPKCANSYLLFAPFVEPIELQSLFGGQDLFAKPSLVETFKGLLGIDGVMKPLECVGEIEELRLAYHMARETYGTERYQLPFDVPVSNFDYQRKYPTQAWASLVAIEKPHQSL